MKKIISMILALVMVMGLSVTAMAEGDNPASKKSAGTVTITDFSATPAQPGTTNDPTQIPVPATGDVKALNISEFDKDSNNKTNYVVMEWTVDSSLTYAVGETDYQWNVYNTATGDNGATTETKLTNNNETATTGENTTPPKANVGRYDQKGKWTGKATITVTVENWSNVDVYATTKWAPGKVVTGNSNGVTKDIVVSNMPTDVKSRTIARADKNANGELLMQTDTPTKAEIYKAIIDNTKQTYAKNDCYISAGAIANSKDGSQNATIGTLSVTIANVAPTGGGN